MKKLTSGFPAARIGRGGPPGRRVRQIVVDMLHSREFDPFGPFCADANPAPSEASPPCAVAPLPHARLPMNSSLDETKGKFSSLQSIEKSQNVEIIAQSGVLTGLLGRSLARVGDRIEGARDFALQG